jgi:hypothetical protein
VDLSISSVYISDLHSRSQPNADPPPAPTWIPTSFQYLHTPGSRHIDLAGTVYRSSISEPSPQPTSLGETSKRTTTTTIIVDYHDSRRLHTYHYRPPRQPTTIIVDDHRSRQPSQLTTYLHSRLLRSTTADYYHSRPPSQSTFIHVDRDIGTAFAPPSTQSSRALAKKIHQRHSFSPVSDCADITQRTTRHESRGHPSPRGHCSTRERSSTPSTIRLIHTFVSWQSRLVTG